MSFIKDLLFPRSCLSCSFLGSYICLSCQRDLWLIKDDSCIYCGRKSLYGLTHPGCRRINGIDGFIAIYHYNPTLKKIIKNIKYRLVREALDELLIILNPQTVLKTANYRKFSKNIALQPVPLHPLRFNQRGFNQAEVISDFLSQRLRFLKVDILIRNKNTSSQAQMKDKISRYLNLRGAFVINPALSKIQQQVRDKNYILVDDVVTSGSTIREAAATLKRSGAVKTYVFALAKG